MFLLSKIAVHFKTQTWFNFEDDAHKNPKESSLVSIFNDLDIVELLRLKFDMILSMNLVRFIFDRKQAAAIMFAVVANREKVLVSNFRIGKPN